MKRAIVMALGVAAVVSSAAAIGFGASNAQEPDAIGRQHYLAARAGLENASTGSAARCESLASSSRDICHAEVTAYQIVRSAELEHAYRHTQGSARAAQRAHIEARYQVERAKCAALGGARKDLCLVRVHAVRGRAMLDAASPYMETQAAS